LDIIVVAADVDVNIDVIANTAVTATVMIAVSVAITIVITTVAIAMMAIVSMVAVVTGGSCNACGAHKHQRSHRDESHDQPAGAEPLGFVRYRTFAENHMPPYLMLLQYSL
jgi:hypothetical protein